MLSVQQRRQRGSSTSPATGVAGGAVFTASRTTSGGRRRSARGSNSNGWFRVMVILAGCAVILLAAATFHLLFTSSTPGAGPGGFAEPAIVALNLLIETTSSHATTTTRRRMRVGTKDQDKEVLLPPAAAAAKNENAPSTSKEKESELVIKSMAPDGSSSSKNERPKATDTGIRVDDPELYVGEDLKGDSSTATVMGMASGYGINVYKRFVGSLRMTGYDGHIILGVAPDISPNTLKYLEYRNVTAKKMTWVNCTYRDPKKDNDIFASPCAHPYPDIKVRWSRFPLARDWLLECESCTGPVLVMDVRDSFFQLNPFGPGSPTIRGLQVYQEHASQTTQHWLTKWPIETCKGIEFIETMLCSGTTTGTRSAMLAYLNIIYEEMKVWISDVEHCHFDINGDDQSIHNYLYYTGQLPFATSIPNRNGIVNTVGVEAARIWKQHKQSMMLKGFPESEAGNQPYEGADGKMRWIGGAHFNLTDDEGYLTDADGTRSRVVHQWDRFGGPFMRDWLMKQDFVHDGDDISVI